MYVRYVTTRHKKCVWSGGGSLLHRKWGEGRGEVDERRRRRRRRRVAATGAKIARGRRNFISLLLLPPLPLPSLSLHFKPLRFHFW